MTQQRSDDGWRRLIAIDKSFFRGERREMEQAMFRYILVPSTGYHTDAAVFASALAIARQSTGHLLFLHVRADPGHVLADLAGPGDIGSSIDYAGLIGSLEEQGAARQMEAERAFRAFCERERLTLSATPHPGAVTAEWKLEVGDETRHLIEYSHIADLLVIGRNGENGLSRTDLLERAVLGSGRPVLIAASRPPERLTGTIAVAWKDGGEAARSVSTSLPFIESADRVIILMVNEGAEQLDRSGEQLRSALSWHNPNTTLQHLKKDKQPAVETLLEAARAANADLLIMGAYGHSRLHEMVFGGFTRRILNAAGLPVLMAH